jgi:hypothetical protein
MMQKRNIKGFIFTLDAIFSLVVASVGVSILLYANFATPGSYSAPGTLAYGTLQSMLQTTIGSISKGSQYVGVLTLYSNTSSANWPQAGHDQGLSSSSAFSLKTPYLLYTFNTPSNMLPSIAINGQFAYIAAGNKIYVINATNGRYLSSFPAGNPASIVTAPAVYKNTVFYANATGYVNGVNVQNSLIRWNFSAGNAITTPLEIENNYLVFGTATGFYLINPLNGTRQAYASLQQPSSTPAYGDGEYIVSTASSGSQNYLYSYVMNGNSLLQVWNVPLTSSKTTSPVFLNGSIAVGSGSILYVFTIGGNQITAINLGLQLIGISGLNNNYYAETDNGIYRYSGAGNSVTGLLIQQIAVNSTPSPTQSVLYFSSGKDLFEGYTPDLRQSLWNISLQSNYSNSGSYIELAYGNAYVVGGNTLYAFGSYRSQPNDNLLQTMSNMYLNGQGAYASIMLSNLYNASTGIFINNSYAPDLGVASFNGANSLVDVGTPSNAPATNTLTISVWFKWDGKRYPASIFEDAATLVGKGFYNNGEYNIFMYRGTASTTTYFSFFVNGGFAATATWNAPDTNWHNLIATYNGTTAKLYLDGSLLSSGSYSTTIQPTAYPLCIGSEAGNYGSNAIYDWGGNIADVQIYSTVFSQQQVSQEYQTGAFGMPNNMNGLALWLPLDGNADDYSGNFRNGVPSGVSYIPTSYLPPRLANAYQISKASTPLFLNNNGILKSYNVSVVVWR